MALEPIGDGLFAAGPNEPVDPGPPSSEGTWLRAITFGPDGQIFYSYVLID